MRPLREIWKGENYDAVIAKQIRMYDIYDAVIAENCVGVELG